MEISVKQTESVKNKIIQELESAPNYNTRLFTEFEDDMIRKYYPTKGANAVAKALKKHSRQITNRASTLGVKRI